MSCTSVQQTKLNASQLVCLGRIARIDAVALALTRVSGNHTKVLPSDRYSRPSVILVTDHDQLNVKYRPYGLIVAFMTRLWCVPCMETIWNGKVVLGEERLSSLKRTPGTHCACSFPDADGTNAGACSFKRSVIATMMWGSRVIEMTIEADEAESCLRLSSPREQRHPLQCPRFPSSTRNRAFVN